MVSVQPCHRVVFVAYDACILTQTVACCYFRPTHKVREPSTADIGADSVMDSNFNDSTANVGAVIDNGLKRATCDTIRCFTGCCGCSNATCDCKESYCDLPPLEVEDNTAMDNVFYEANGSYGGESGNAKKGLRAVPLLKEE